MARVNDAEVKSIIDTDLNTCAFIDSATILVDKLAGHSCVNDALLKEIEKWLSAHFVAIADPQVKTVKDGVASVTIFGEVGKGIEGTTYGQQALLLDCTGILASSSSKKASLCIV